LQKGGISLTRITKKPDIRRNEILDSAQELFNSKGYEKTSINDIANETGVAKGTIYHYFKTKEEIFDAIVERYFNGIINAAKKIVEDKSIDTMNKIEQMMFAEYNLDMGNMELFKQLHTWTNLEMNQKSFIYMIKFYSPILAEVIKQGIEDGLFSTDYPLEGVRLIMTEYRMLFDKAHFEWNKEEAVNMAKAHQDIIECSLRAKKGSFQFITDMVTQYF
jgi:AcrR family transcriptional regulator